LHGDGRQRRDGDDAVKLGTMQRHRLRGPPTQPDLSEQVVVLRTRGLEQDLLSCQPCDHGGVHVLLAGPVTEFEGLPRVLGGLHQSWHDHRLEMADTGGRTQQLV
jgi:hypothetical protein